MKKCDKFVFLQISAVFETHQKVFIKKTWACAKASAYDRTSQTVMFPAVNLNQSPWSNNRRNRLPTNSIRSPTLCVLMSQSRFKANLHSAVASLSKNYLLEAGEIYQNATLAKWLSVRLRTKWLWVQIPLQQYAIVGKRNGDKHISKWCQL